MFDIGSLSQAQWEKADKECEFEAAKAVAPRKDGDITGDIRRKLYILCVETKGIKYRGTEHQIKRQP